jgi:hypothetical protein
MKPVQNSRRNPAKLRSSSGGIKEKESQEGTNPDIDSTLVKEVDERSVVVVKDDI